MATVTGFDHVVISHLLLQHELHGLLREAIVLIESNHLSALGFRCMGGTHRSVCMAYLLLLLVYPEASIHVYSHKVAAAAEQVLDVR